MGEQIDNPESVACLRFIQKEFPRTMSNVFPSCTLSLHVFCVSIQCCLHTCPYTHHDVSVFGFESLHTSTL